MSTWQQQSTLKTNNWWDVCLTNTSIAGEKTNTYDISKSWNQHICHKFRYLICTLHILSTFLRTSDPFLYFLKSYIKKHHVHSELICACKTQYQMTLCQMVFPFLSTNNHTSRLQCVCKKEACACRSKTDYLFNLRFTSCLLLCNFTL